MKDHYADVVHRVAAFALSLGMDVDVQPGMLGRATVHATTEDAIVMDELVRDAGLPMLHKWYPPIQTPNVEVRGAEQASPAERPA